MFSEFIYIYPTGPVDVPLDELIAQSLENYIMDTTDPDFDEDTVVDASLITQEARVAQKLGTSYLCEVRRIRLHLWLIDLHDGVSLADLLKEVGGAISARYNQPYDAITLVHDDFPD